MFLSVCDDSIEFCAGHGLDVYTHCLASGSVISLFFWDAEAVVVLVSLIGWNPHFENAESFRSLICNFVVIVSVLDLFKTLILAEFEFMRDRPFKVDREGVLETEFELAVRFYNRCFRRLDQIALLRDVLVRLVVSLAD